MEMPRYESEHLYFLNLQGISKYSSFRPEWVADVWQICLSNDIISVFIIRYPQKLRNFAVCWKQCLGSVAAVHRRRRGKSGQQREPHFRK